MKNNKNILAASVLEACEVIVSKGLNANPKLTGVADGEVDLAVAPLTDVILRGVLKSNRDTLTRLAVGLVCEWKKYRSLPSDEEQQTESRKVMLDTARRMKEAGWSTEARPFANGGQSLTVMQEAGRMRGGIGGSGFKLTFS